MSIQDEKAKQRVAVKPSSKAEAWILFDRIVANAASDGEHSNPWARGPDGQLRCEPDYPTLERLLGVPLHLKAGTQSGVPALALDVWLSYEFRRAGFLPDQVWPRPTNPRILPAAVAALLETLPIELRRQVAGRLEKSTSLPGVTSSSANILGKNYLKQVDVLITDWATGPELLVSTKRMDSSYGKNAPNRVEGSYGDAKNLRLRHPLAALGFAFGFRSDILEKEPRTAERLFDLLVKLWEEDDAYHSTGLVLMEYADEAAIAEATVDNDGEGILEPDPEPDDEEADAPADSPANVIDATIKLLPKVTIRQDATPVELAPARFLADMINRVRRTTPVNLHAEARRHRTLAT